MVYYYTNNDINFVFRTGSMCSLLFSELNGKDTARWSRNSYSSALYQIRQVDVGFAQYRPVNQCRIIDSTPHSMVSTSTFLRFCVKQKQMKGIKRGELKVTKCVIVKGKNIPTA